MATPAMRQRYEDELVERTSELLATGRTVIGLATVTLEPSTPTREIDLDRLEADGGLLGAIAWVDFHGLPCDIWHRHQRVARIEPSDDRTELI